MCIYIYVCVCTSGKKGFPPMSEGKMASGEGCHEKFTVNRCCLGFKLKSPI